MTDKILIYSTELRLMLNLGLELNETTIEKERSSICAVSV